MYFFLFKNYKSVDYFIKPIKYLFILILIIMFFSVLLGDFINSINFLNYELPRNPRPRGFSFEASTFGFHLCGHASADSCASAKTGR